MHQPLASEIKKQVSYFMIKAAFFIINFFAQDPFLEKKNQTRAFFSCRNSLVNRRILVQVFTNLTVH